LVVCRGAFLGRRTSLPDASGPGGATVRPTPLLNVPAGLAERRVARATRQDIRYVSNTTTL